MPTSQKWFFNSLNLSLELVLYPGPFEWELVAQGWAWRAQCTEEGQGLLKTLDLLDLQHVGDLKSEGVPIWPASVRAHIPISPPPPADGEQEPREFYLFQLPRIKMNNIKTCS